ncbi:sensor histidine kinase [Aequorivita marisscotiae]|uniref:histidine kinase n=1 Tax=Aequorivita marisscotiae TaxID=3040348 RepID=A0ABY8KTK5_9FLAO|nr:HAMP domain-containing sensor histidine kinase [Aequorivita sp. Ant34-E75]WGF92761.1 HAMP domain-containing sensor histidine kinase [Aequorivita sp. Ant34-E75]
MKLLNRSLLYLSLAFFFIIGIWAIIFYFNLKDEIRDSIDDGLENNKLLLIQKIRTDTTLLSQNQFGGNNFEIHPISKQTALQQRDVYKDTLMYRANEDDLEPVRILHSAIKYGDKYYKLKVISSLVEEDDLIEDSFWSVVWLFVILVGSTLVINNLILRKLWNPFYDILKRLKNYRLDKEESVINTPTKTAEFRELQQASNTLIRHTQEVYTSQKQFTENASHELQTPLAIISNKLELLLESENLVQTDAQTIAEVITLVQRLTQLNKSLLLLAKIENKQFPEQSIITINELTKESWNNFEDFAQYKQLKINYDEAAKLKVIMDPSLAAILISNLMKNAIFHNTAGGSIHLKFNKHEFSICNTATNTPLQQEYIFTRFQKDASKTQSTGLGLAVCKAICDFYNLPINYSFFENQHCFTVNFKNILP